MNVTRRQALSFSRAAALLLVAGVAAAQDIPLKNWPAPSTWAPSGSGGRTALTDIGGPIPLVPMAPCRQYDSRSFTPLLDNAPRTVTLTGVPCGIQAGATAASVNITVFSITGAGSNGVFKVDTVSPPVTAWINYPPTETQRGNSGVVVLTGGGAIVVQVNQGAGSVDFTVDVNGYFIGNGVPLTTNERFWVEGSYSGGGVITGTNTYNGVDSYGGFFESYAQAENAAGAYGLVYGPTGVMSGVRGETRSTTDGTAGVWGDATSTTGITNGVKGTNASTFSNSAGVYGLSGAATNSTANLAHQGVRGESATGNGVIGITAGTGTVGMRGDRVDGTGATLTYGVLGGTSGVVYSGGLSGSGTKNFVEPHPVDPTKMIRYVALEGPEAGTYFRGTSQLVDGLAVIEVPETFRWVTAEEGLTVQVTAVGSPASLYVESQSLAQIVVRSVQPVEATFHYLVQGVRRAYKDVPIVTENVILAPESPQDQLPLYLSPLERQRMIDNGTYNADGTVNMQTAERVGWAQKWRDAERARPEAATRPRTAPAPGARVVGARR